MMSASQELLGVMAPYLERIEAFELEKESEMGQMDVAMMLKVALKNEVEASTLAAHWMAETPITGLKLALARQVGDEAAHYRMIQERLSEMGHDTTDLDPLAQGYSPIFQALMTLESDLERVAAGPFAREALACAKNRQFIRALRKTGDDQTGDLYEKIINKDEEFHHHLGAVWVDRLVKTPEDMEKARLAIEKVLGLAEEVQETLCKTKGLHHTPGC